MININFMPSRRLAWYMARLFVTRSLAVLAILVMVLMALDLLGESGKILNVPGNGEAELWYYVSLRVPMLIARFMPFAVLLGTLIALSGLNQSSEVVAMKAAGLSAHQILAPMIIASFGIAAIAFAFNETLVVNATRTATAWADGDYRPLKVESGILSNVWVRDGSRLIFARHVGGRGTGVHLEGVTIYDRESGALVRTTEAARADQRPGGWRLTDVRVYNTATNVVRNLPTLDSLSGVEPTRFTLAKVSAANRDVRSLGTAITDLENAGRPSAEARTGWWHKFSGPLSTVLMPLLAALAAFGLARSGQVLLRAAIGMALGFTYFVVDNFSVALGNVGAYPPFLAAWAPFLLFLFIGEAVLIRSEE
ncbi:MAG: LPS export ABC transporter permease LptG [Pseudomonadota bacterium]|nr:LPS export ABC transporter permease LptG [Pseudomonadota bacterium]